MKKIETDRGVRYRFDDADEGFRRQFETLLVTQEVEERLMLALLDAAAKQERAKQRGWAEVYDVVSQIDPTFDRHESVLTYHHVTGEFHVQPKIAES